MAQVKKGEKMKNVEIEFGEDGDILILKVDLTKEYGRSRSGKTTIIASTEGNIEVPEHEDIKFGLNVYKK
jgi:hypothetical protein